MKKSANRKRVICAGEILSDVTVNPAPEIIYDGDTSLVDSIVVRPGGDAINNAIDFAKLGNAVTFLGRLSTDPIGEYLIRAGREAGIDMGHTVRTDTPQAKMNILIDAEGKRAFLYYPGTSAEFSVRDIDFSLLEQADLVTVGGTFHLPSFDGEGSASLFREAGKKNVITAMDVTKDFSKRWNSVIEPCYRYLDYFLPSVDQAREIAGTEDEREMADFFLDRGVRNVLIKLGKKGTYFKNAETAFYTGSYSVEVMETTGAGDAFVAGFLTGVLQGFDPEGSVRLGTACSANVIQAVGANAGMKTLEETTAFMNSQPAPEIIYE